MPLYEFECVDCLCRFSVLVGMTSQDEAVVCPKCGHRNSRKLVSRFTRHRSEDERVEAMADRLEGIGEPESPTQMREMVREMGRALDDDMSDEMEEIYEADAEGKLDDEE